MRLALEDRIKDVYAQLPHSERLLADLLMDFPGMLATHSLSELVQRAQTSNAAATRLVKRLGYTHVREIRKQVRQAREEGSPRYLNTFLHDARDFKSGLTQHVECEIQNLLHSFEALNEHMLKQIVQALARARHLWIVGFGNSHMIALSLRQQLIQLRPSVEVLPRPGQVLEKDLSDLNEEDMVIVIGFRRRNETRQKLLKYARQVGVHSLYITDHTEPGESAGTKKQITKQTSWTVRCQTQSTSLFDSYIASYSILNYLCTRLADHLGRSATQRLAQAEKLGEILGS